MALNNAYPILNGIAPSWADIVVKVTPYGGALFTTKDIAAINTSRTVEVGEKRGASGGQVIATTTGAESSEGSITFYRSGFQQALRNLIVIAEANGLVRGNQVAISLVHFDIQVQHTPPGSVEIFDRRLRGCRFTGDTMNAAEGTDAQQVEVPLHIKKIVDMIDGKEVVLL